MSAWNICPDCGAALSIILEAAETQYDSDDQGYIEQITCDACGYTKREYV